METEEQFICTENQLQPSTAALEDVLCTAADNWQFKRVSSNSPFLIGPDGYQVFQGLANITSKDHLAEVRPQEGFLPLDKTCRQNDQQTTDCSEFPVHVKSEKIDSADCVSDCGEPRQWVVCEGGLLLEVLKVEQSDWSVETLQDCVKGSDDNKQRGNTNVLDVEPFSNSADTKQFPQSNHCNDHKQISTGEEQYAGDSCDTSLAYPTAVCHQGVHTSDTNSVCPKTNSTNLAIPDKVHKGVNICTCFVCGKSYTTPKRLKTHYKKCHADVNPHTCYRCGKAFIKSSHLQAHERIHTGVKPYTCFTCGKSFTQSGHLRVHERTHTCKKSFTTSSNAHERNHADVNPYTCSLCEKSFTKLSHLKIHEKIHTGVKSHACATCGKTFTECNALKVHERIHTGIKPYTCSTCGKSFTQSGQLKIHGRVHTGVKPYTCFTCGKSFTLSSTLKVHERIHTGIKPYTCSRCGKSFSQSCYRKVHERLHTGVKPYSCTTCGKLFTTNSHRKCHEKKCEAVNVFYMWKVLQTISLP